MSYFFFLECVGKCINGGTGFLRKNNKTHITNRFHHYPLLQFTTCLTSSGSE